MIKYLLYNITKLKKLKKKILFISEKKFREMIKGQEKFFTLFYPYFQLFWRSRI